jgi:hypothetical protein
MNTLPMVAEIEPTALGRPSHQELAAPSRSEADERKVILISRAFGRLCDAVNTCDHQVARHALDHAVELLTTGSEADVDRAIEEVHSTLVRGSQPATRKQVARAVASLIGSFPNFGSKSEARLFGGQLAEDVAAAEPTAMALDMMVRTIRRKSKFMPAISEVLVELDVAGRALDMAWTAVSQFVERWGEAQDQVERLAGYHQRWLASEVSKYRAARASGADVRRFPAEVIAAANPPDPDVPF